MESLVEGVFGRAFRRQIHPVEIAKGLTKQMDEGRMVSISRTYAPNDFTVHLSKEDTEAIEAYQDALRDELIQYASTHADTKDYHLMTPPRVRFETEDSLRFGEFGITAKLTGGTGPRAEDAPQDTSGQTRIFRTEETGGGGGAGARAVVHRPLAGVRHRRTRPERLEEAREAPASRQRLRRRGPRLDQRDPPGRRSHRPRTDRERRRVDLRPEHRPLRPPDQLPGRARAGRKFGSRGALVPCSSSRCRSWRRRLCSCSCSSPLSTPWCAEASGTCGGSPTTRPSSRVGR